MSSPVRAAIAVLVAATLAACADERRPTPVPAAEEDASVAPPKPDARPGGDNRPHATGSGGAAGGADGPGSGGAGGAEADAGQGGSGGARADGGPPSVDAPSMAPGKRWRIMPLGDSITEAKNGYRGYLYNLLTGAGYNVDFVGSKKDAPTVGGDPDNEGRGGHTIGPDTSAFCQWHAATAMHRCQTYRFNLFDNMEVIARTEVDVILLLIGINDLTPQPTLAMGKDGVLRPVDPKEAPDKLAALVAELRKRKPAAKIVVSSLIRLRDTTGAGWAEFQALNARAATLGNAASNDAVSFVDLNAVPLTKEDFGDAVHPNESGGEKIAKGWFDALTPLLGKADGPVITPAYKEDFATASPAWALTGGKIEAGRLTLSNFAGPAKAVNDTDAFVAPYTLRGRVNAAGSGLGNKFRVVFDRAEDGSGRFVELAGGAMGKAVLGARAAGGGSSTLATAEMPYAANGGVQLEIRRDVDAITVHATKNGATVTLFSGIKAAAPAAGKLGAETEYNHADFDDITVLK